MGVKCHVCGKLDYSHPELSFHRFPADAEKRKIWFSIVGFTEDQKLPKKPYICSDHFDPRHVLTRENGRRFLDPAALPQIRTSVFVDSSSSSSASSACWTFPSYSSPLEKSRGSGVEVIENSPDGIPENVPRTSKVQQLRTSKQDVSTPFTDPDTGSEEKQKVECMTAEAMENLAKVSDPSELDQVSSATETATEEEKEQSRSTCGETLCRTTAVKRKLYYKKSSVKKRKRGYIGDITTSDFSTPEKRSRNWRAVKKTVIDQRRKIHNLQMTVRRQRLRIVSLNSLLRLLKKKGLITESSETVIKASLPGPTQEIFERMLKGPSTQKYSPGLRTFALTLSFYSPKAYDFVRNTFNKSLPHLDTISKWYRSIDGSPGFTNEALQALSLKQKNSTHPLLCNLVMDEMSIRRQVEWTGNKFTGLVDIGTNLDDDSLPEARETLVFMVVCLNGQWKVPVGYFLLDGLTGTEKAGLVRKCLELLHETGIIVTSLTFDGAATNLIMAEELGADFTNSAKLQTSFKHPMTQNEVFIFLDACHMVKLVRNCFASQGKTGILKDDQGRLIQWDYISKLVEKQNLEGLQAATKLRLRHISWEREKMKVRLATQTLSKSVSDALTFLREDLKDPTFINSEGTSCFLLNFNNLFDILNSRNRFAKYSFKRPLSAGTADHFLSYMECMRKYILGLTLDEKPVTRSRRKTGFLGFLICMDSLENMYKKYVVEEKIIKYILSYKLSQDHLELFFGTIRSKGGHNNNPTARQFEAAYKRLLVRSQITAPTTGNAVDLQEIAILTCGSQKIPLTENGENAEETEDYRNFVREVENNIESALIGSNAWDLTIYTEDIVAYIAGFVVKGLKKIVTCVSCLCLLDVHKSPSLLLERKRYGRLSLAGPLVVETCKIAEKLFRIFNATHNILNKNIKNLSDLLINLTMNKLPSSLFNYFGDHLFDDDAINGHQFRIIKLILKSFFNIRIHHETVKRLDLIKKYRTRSINTKTILFRGE